MIVLTRYQPITETNEEKILKNLKFNYNEDIWNHAINYLVANDLWNCCNFVILEATKINNEEYEWIEIVRSKFNTVSEKVITLWKINRNQRIEHYNILQSK